MARNRRRNNKAPAGLVRHPVAKPARRAVPAPKVPAIPKRRPSLLVKRLRADDPKATKTVQGEGVAVPKGHPRRTTQADPKQKPKAKPLHDSYLRSDPDQRNTKTCKERPDPTPRKSGGGSRPFVPWCSRR